MDNITLFALVIVGPASLCVSALLCYLAVLHLTVKKADNTLIYFMDKSLDIMVDIILKSFKLPPDDGSNMLNELKDLLNETSGKEDNRRTQSLSDILKNITSTNTRAFGNVLNSILKPTEDPVVLSSCTKGKVCLD